MSDWSSYQVRDFILFSKDTLLEVYEAYNYDFWPWQLFWLAGALIIVVCLAKPSPLRPLLLFTVLAGAWAWVGGIFHLRYFLPINWAAQYFAYAFFVEAFLLLLWGCLFPKLRLRSLKETRAKLGLLLFIGVAFVPLELIFEQKLSQVLLFGWGPERTALGTLGLLYFSVAGKKPWLLMLTFIPALCCVVSLAVYQAMK